MMYYELLFIALTWLWTFNAFRVKETTQLMFSGRVVVTRNNKKLAWVLLSLTVFYTASFVFFSVIAN